jgi:hypothetical protein
VTRLASSSHADAHSVIQRLLAVTVAGASLFSIAIMASARLIVLVIGGSAFLPACTALRLMAIVPTLVAVSHVLSVSGLCAMGSGSVVSRLLTPIALASGVWIAFLAHQAGATGAAAAVLSTEACVTLVLVKAYRTRRASLAAAESSSSVEAASPSDDDCNVVLSSSD